jgi:hypothetical protein
MGQERNVGEKIEELDEGMKWIRCRRMEVREMF